VENLDCSHATELVQRGLDQITRQSSRGVFSVPLCLCGERFSTLWWKGSQRYTVVLGGAALSALR